MVNSKLILKSQLPNPCSGSVETPLTTIKEGLFEDEKGHNMDTLKILNMFYILLFI